MLPAVPSNETSRPEAARKGKASALLPVMLDAGRAQAGKPVLIDRMLPAEEFLGGQRITLAGFVEAEESAANRRDHLRLAPNDPAAGAGRRKVCNRQRTAVRPDHIFDPRAVGFGHCTLTHSTDHVPRTIVRRA